MGGKCYRENRGYIGIPKDYDDNGADTPLGGMEYGDIAAQIGTTRQNIQNLTANALRALWRGRVHHWNVKGNESRFATVKWWRLVDDPMSILEDI